MRQRLGLLCGLSFTIVLCACGRNDGSQEVLDRMHSRLEEKIIGFTDTMQVADASETAMKLHMEVMPIAEIFPVSATADISVKQAYDMKSDAAHPVMHLSLDANVDTKVPAAMFGPTEDPDALAPLKATVSAEGKTIDGKVFLKLKEGSLSIPTADKNAMISDKVKQSWYGTTMKELNAMLNGSDDDAGMGGKQPMIDIEKILNSTIERQRSLPLKLKNLAATLAFWKPLELLPEENGMMRVRVELDKKKTEKSLIALQDFATSLQNPFGVPNPTVEQDMEALQKSIHDMLTKDGSTIRGILLADAVTADCMGFDGEILDGKGKTTSTIHALLEKNGDASFTVKKTDTLTGSTVAFSKKGDVIELKMDGKTMLTGTQTKKELHVQVLDDIGATQLVADLIVADYNKNAIDVHGKISLPAAGVDIVIAQATNKTSNNHKDSQAHIDATVQFQNNPVLKLLLDSTRKEQEAVAVSAENTFLPIDALKVDLLPFMQELQGM